MSRTRLSTTVDADLLESARRASGKPDSALVDEALAALLARHRSAVNLDSVESVSIAILVERLGRLADVRMREICAALAVAVDCSG